MLTLYITTNYKFVKLEADLDSSYFSVNIAILEFYGSFSDEEP